jgi:hypothetical protein
LKKIFISIIFASKTSFTASSVRRQQQLLVIAPGREPGRQAGARAVHPTAQQPLVLQFVHTAVVSDEPVNQWKEK